MGSVTNYKSADVKRIINTKSAIELLDIDTRNAIEVVMHQHPSIMTVINKLLSVAGTFIIDTDGLPLTAKIIREACTEFENNYERIGIRVAFHQFVKSIKDQLPRLLDYAVIVHSTSSRTKLVDFISEDITDHIPKSGCKIEIRYMPIKSGMTDHELSLLLMGRIFNRADLLFFGVPNVGFQAAHNFRNSARH